MKDELTDEEREHLCKLVQRHILEGSRQSRMLAFLARASEPEQAAREPADVATTIYRKLGCVCQWEAGDSPCPVHDRFCADDLAQAKEPTT